MSQATLLLVDDDPGLSGLMNSTLEKAGYRVVCAEDADEGFAALKKTSVDLMLLDLELPGLSGFKVLELLKSDPKTESLPVIIISVRKEEGNKIRGLRTGADDYLVKPFSSAELLARVEALLRRSRRGGAPDRIFESGHIRIDLDRREVWARGRRVELRPTEFNLLAVLMQHKGYVFSYRNLGDALSQGAKDMTSENLYYHVNMLRSKLGADGNRIETVHGTGYKFAD